MSGAGAQRILVVRTDRLGDVLLSLPTLAALRRALPEASLAFLTSPAVAPLLTDHPSIDELLVDERRGAHRGVAGFVRLARTLRRRRFDVAVVLRPTLRVASLVWAAGAKRRIGTAYRAYACLFNDRRPLHRRRSGLHELELNLALITGLAGEPSVEAPRVVPGAAERHAARELVGEAARTVVLHPGSGGSAREWPPARFAELTRLLAAHDVQVLVTGSDAERQLSGAIAAAAPEHARSIAGQTSLRLLAAVLERADVVAGASTGPVHLAAAVGTPVVALYPPIRDAHPRRWGPRGAGISILSAEAPACERCIGDRCPVWDCMESITAAQVMARLEPHLSAGGRSA